MNATLPMGAGTQTPDEFVHAQSASTGLPERMCRANMKKNMFVLSEMRRILDSLTRGLDLEVLTRGYGEERGVPISFQVQSPVVGLVRPRRRHLLLPLAAVGLAGALLGTAAAQPVLERTSSRDVRTDVEVFFVFGGRK